jgi:hypothetical protein
MIDSFPAATEPQGTRCVSDFSKKTSIGWLLPLITCSLQRAVAGRSTNGSWPYAKVHASRSVEMRSAIELFMSEWLLGYEFLGMDLAMQLSEWAMNLRFGRPTTTSLHFKSIES